MLDVLCDVDVAPLLPHLAGITWPGVGNMIALAQFPPALALDAGVIVGRVLERLPGRRRGIVYLARRVPGEFIGPHTDLEDGGCRERVHVPLLTDPRAELLLDGAWQHLAAGRAYLIDPGALHAVRHQGALDRVHLFFNAVSGDGG